MRNMPNRIHSTCVKGWSRILANWKALLLSQLLAFILAASGAANATLHLECNISAPATQAGLVYFLLSFHLLFMCISFSSNGGERIDCNNDRNSGTASLNSRCYGGLSINTKDFDNNNGIEDIHSITTSASVKEEFITNTVEVQEQNQQNTETTTCTSSISSNPTNPTMVMETSATVKMPSTRLWIYFVMAFLDVEANYCIYLAYRYTTLTSVSLLDALAIPATMLCSKFLLTRSFRSSHYVGSMICMVGIVLNVLGDSKQQQEEDDNGMVDGEDNDDSSLDKYPNKFLGDILAIIGGSLYGLNDVLAERAIKHLGGVREYLGMVGIFGAFVCLIQALILERDELLLLFGGIGSSDETKSIDGDTSVELGETCSLAKGWLILMASTLSTTIAYNGMSYFLVLSEATLLNLSLLVSDLWSVAFSVVAEGIIPSFFFWVALLFIFLGVFVYELSPSPITGGDVGLDEAVDQKAVFQRLAVERRSDDRDETEDYKGSIII